MTKILVAEHPHWHMIGISQQGPGKAKTGEPCDDDCNVDSHRNLLWAVAADGVGSMSHANLGSKTAVRAAVNHCVELARSQELADNGLHENALKDAFSAARVALETEAELENLSIDALATTLQVLLVSEDTFAYGRIGDGGALITGNQGAFFLGSPPAAGNYTASLHQADWSSVLEQEHRPLDGIYAFALFTDGMEDYFAHEPDDGGIWLPSTSLITDLQEFLVNKGSWGLSAALLPYVWHDDLPDDDRTMVLLLKRGLNPVEPAEKKSSSLMERLKHVHRK